MSIPLTIPTGLSSLYTDGVNIYRVWTTGEIAYALTLDTSTGQPKFSEVYTYPLSFVTARWAPYLNDGTEPVFPQIPEVEPTPEPEPEV